MVALFGSVVLFWILRSRIGGIHGRALVASTTKILLASAAMGVGISALSNWVQTAIGVSRTARLAELAICVPAGVVLFYWLCRFARVPELELGVNAVVGPMLQWLPFRRDRIH